MGHIQNLQSIFITDERIPELDGHSCRTIQLWGADFSADLWMKGIVKADDLKPAIAKDVREHTRDRNAAGSIQPAVGIEGDCTMEEIIGRIAVKQRTHSSEVL